MVELELGKGGVDHGWVGGDLIARGTNTDWVWHLVGQGIEIEAYGISRALSADATAPWER